MNNSRKLELTSMSSLELIELFLSNIRYENGVVKKYDEVFPISNQLIKSEEFPNWVEGIDLVGYCMDEARRFEKPYDGKMPNEDIEEEALKIYHKLKNIPFNYIFYFKLPEGLNLQNEIIITDQINIFEADKSMVKRIDEINRYTYRETIFDLKELLKDKIGAEPKFTNLKIGSTYLSIKTEGLVGRFSTITEGIDPLHVYKILIAFLNIKNMMNYGGFLEALLGRSGSADHGKEALVYKDKLEFVGEIDRPSDEFSYISKLIFSEEAKKDSNLQNELIVFSKLISEMNNVYLNQERNKIINSLYWYFESSTSSNDAFKTMLYVSMIDSFFTLNDKKEEKFKQIISETDPDIKPTKESTEWKALSELYNRRNEIAHGKIHLLEVDSMNKVNKELALINDYTVKKIYNKLIISKIEKLLVS